jgi:hypothetical protein
MNNNQSVKSSLRKSVIQTSYYIVKVYGGPKEVISTEGKGYIFLFTLPALV